MQNTRNNKLTPFLGQDNKYDRKALLEEHISIVAEPNVSYFSHRTLNPVSRTILPMQYLQV